jgi:hypothetical protein
MGEFVSFKSNLLKDHMRNRGCLGRPGLDPDVATLGYTSWTKTLKPKTLKPKT